MEIEIHHTISFLLTNALDSLIFYKLFFRFTVTIRDVYLYVFLRITAAPQTIATLTARSVLSVQSALDTIYKQHRVRRKFPQTRMTT